MAQSGFAATEGSRSVMLERIAGYFCPPAGSAQLCFSCAAKFALVPELCGALWELVEHRDVHQQSRSVALWRTCAGSTNPLTIILFLVQRPHAWAAGASVGYE
jgi:hypothetical protein